MKADNPEEAIGEFLGVPALEEEKGDWYTKELLEELNSYTEFVLVGGSKG